MNCKLTKANFKNTDLAPVHMRTNSTPVKQTQVTNNSNGYDNLTPEDSMRKSLEANLSLGTCDAKGKGKQLGSTDVQIHQTPEKISISKSMGSSPPLNGLNKSCRNLTSTSNSNDINGDQQKGPGNCVSSQNSKHSLSHTSLISCSGTEEKKAISCEKVLIRKSQEQYSNSLLASDTPMGSDISSDSITNEMNQRMTSNSISSSNMQTKSEVNTNSVGNASNQINSETESRSASINLNDPSPIDLHYINYENEFQMGSIMKLIQKDLSEPYSIYTYRYFIHNWPKLCFLTVHKEKVVGAIVCKLDIHKKTTIRGYIAMLAVDEHYRKRKIGSNLVLRAIRAMARDNADEVVLETEITNQSALQLYENLGFVRDKRLFRYYLNGVDALRLKLWLR